MPDQDGSFEYNFKGKYTGKSTDKNVGNDELYKKIGHLEIQLELETGRLEKLEKEFSKIDPKVSQADIDLVKLTIASLENDIANAKAKILKN